MMYRGHVQNGVVVLEGQVSLPDGAVVNVELVSPAPNTNEATGESASAQRFQQITGSIDDLPTDFAAQHDHYIHGTARR